jgi:hypothetical protein
LQARASDVPRRLASRRHGPLAPRLGIRGQSRAVRRPGPRVGRDRRMSS